MHFTFKGDTALGDSTFWDTGLTQSDVTQVNVMAESKRSDTSTHLWHHKQTDNSKSSSNGISRNQIEGSWLSSPHSSSPSHLCQDTTDDGKSFSVSAWPISKTRSEIVNKNHLLDQVDKENKVEAAATSCRLFGIELIDHPRNSQKASGVPGTDANRQSDISKASKERKQEQLQASPKETTSKQICNRSCTKVLDTCCLFT